VLRAVYGKLPENPKILPEAKSVDVTAKLAALVKDGTLSVKADNDLAGDPAFLALKELRVSYTLDGVSRTATAPEGQELRIPEVLSGPVPLVPSLRPAGLVAWENGRYTLTGASGKDRAVDVARIPAPQEIQGPWDVTFQVGRGAPEGATFEKLISWPDHADPGIRYFSGTATYRCTFSLEESVLDRNGPLLLDLGQVQVIAEAKLNGKDLGILWKLPYRVEIREAARAGANELEVRVTNLWPNRLIGDEQVPDDCEWNGKPIARWPDWLLKGEPRPVKERVTFTTWKHWTKNSPLLPSGLLGPVRVVSGAVVPLDAKSGR
jgi:hypothetical protein